MVYGSGSVPNASDGMITTHFVMDGNYSYCSGNETECSNAVDGQGQPILVYCAKLPNRGPYDFFSDGTIYDTSTDTKLHDDYIWSGCCPCSMDGSDDTCSDTGTDGFPCFDYTDCKGGDCLGSSCNCAYEPKAFGTSWKSIPCTIAAIAEQDNIAKKFLNDNSFAAGLEPSVCDPAAPISKTYNSVFVDSSDDDVAPESVVTVKWVLTCENLMGNVLHQRTQSISVCVNNTDTKWVPSCETSSNIVTCAYADASISGTSDEMNDYRCAENDWASWLRMAGGTMPA